MIGVDTNVLARLFVNDDARQAALARAFFAQRTEGDPAFLSALVLVEFVWLLSARYRYPAEAVHRALEVIFASANVVVEREPTVKAAVDLARETGADIPDCIIASLAMDNGCRGIVTFDRLAAGTIPEMELLA